MSPVWLLVPLLGIVAIVLLLRSRGGNKVANLSDTLNKK